MAFPASTLQPIGIRHGIRHCPGGDDESPCINPGLGGRVYYVDPVNGSDTYDGRLSYPVAAQLRGPWQTLTYAFSAAAPLGLASANVKGAYHDYLVMLPGACSALETWPLVIPASKDNIHIIGNNVPGFNSPEIGTMAGSHATETTLQILGKGVSIEGVIIFGPAGDFPVVTISEEEAYLRYNWIRALDTGGDTIAIPAAGNGQFSTLAHNWIDCYEGQSIAVISGEPSIQLYYNRLHSSGGGVQLEDTADWCKIIGNRIYNAMGDFILDFGINLLDCSGQNEIDENRIGPATAGVSGVQRRIYDLSAKVSNFFGRNYQLGVYEAGPPAGINRAGDIITDGGAGSGYARD